jgi:HlyD family secretion protein
MSIMPPSRQVVETTTAENGEVSRRQSQSVRRPPRRKSGGWFSMLLSFVVGLGVLGGIAYLLYDRFYATEGADSTGKFMTTTVKKDDLVITVTEDGNVESAKNRELKCEVPGPITILDIVPDGSVVKEGDTLVKLDSYSTEDSITTQQIAVAKAEAAKITSEKNHAAAEIAVEEYREGTFVQEMQQYEADITVAKQNLSSANNLKYYSEKMHRKGYVTQLDVESKEFAVEQAKLNLAVAERKKDVLEKFTKLKMLEDLTSKRDSAEALMKSDRAAYEKETRTLDKFEKQLKHCTILAPADGMVVYANDMGGGFRMQQAPKIDLGASVNQYQTILKLPDLKHMQVKTLVHETKVDQLRLGMRARVKIQDLEFQGEITSIANQPEQSNWWQGNTKEYATLISIDGEPTDLKPGMTAEVEILVAEKKDVLTIPVQCVVENAGKFHAYVKNASGVPEKRELVLGGTNDTVIEVDDGLKEGEQVLLNPRADVPEASTEEHEIEKVDVGKRFGQTKPMAAPGGAAPGGAAAPPAAGGPAAGGATTGGPAAGGATTGGPAAGGAAAGGPQGAGQGQGGGPGRGGPGGEGTPRRPPTFKEQDKNGDGKITVDELPERAQQFFGMMDTNGDGGVDQAEHKAMLDRMRQMQQQGGGGFGGPPGGGQ